MMNILFISNLYPNSRDTTRAIFNKQKIAYLKKYCDITVVAPMQYYPFKYIFSNSDDKKIPAKEMIDGLEVYHPRVLYIPKLFRCLYGVLYYLSIRTFINKLCKSNEFDIIYSSWIFPDGYAAMRLAKTIKRPFIAGVHGSDINLYIRTFLRRRIIIKIIREARKVIAVSNSLKEKIVSLGISESKISVIYNGINHNLFCIREKRIARKELNLKEDDKIVIFIGNLVKVKGVEYLLKAMKLSALTDWKIYIIGDGVLRRSLEEMIDEYGLNKRVVMTGVCEHSKIPFWLNAADLLCLPSLEEGMPNVVLEAMACGIPVVASRVGDNGMIIDSKTGILADPKDVGGLVAGIEDALRREWDRSYISQRASKFTWESNAAELFECIRSCKR